MQLEFELAVDIIYHRAREDFLARAHRFCMFLTVALGAGTVAAVSPTWTGIATALVGALDLTLEFTRRSDEHRDLRRAYMKLVAKLAAHPTDPAELARIRRNILRLSALEPPHFVVVGLIANNQAVVALGRDPAARARIPLRKRALAHVWRFEES